MIEKRNWIVLIAMVIIAIVITILLQGKGGENEVSIDQKFEESTIRTDIEPVSSRLPWLQIVSCQWKSIVLGDEGIPGPSDVMVCGYIEVVDEQLQQLQNMYEWIESNVAIHMVPTDMQKENINLTTSSKYDSFYTSLQKNAKIQLYIDFNNRLVYFSGVFQ